MRLFNQKRGNRFGPRHSGQKRRNASRPPYTIRPRYRSEMATESFGESAKKKRVHKKFSIWGGDDSGNVHLSSKSPEYFTLAAVSVNGDFDYDEFIRGITLYNGEIKFSDLRRDHPDQARELTRRLGEMDVLILCTARHKRDFKGTNRHDYYREVADELVEAIKVVDDSKWVYIELDENDWLNREDYREMSDERTIVYPWKSTGSIHIQLADVAVSSFRHGLLPPDKGSRGYFDEIREKTVNISEGPFDRTQQSQLDTASDRNRTSEKDKKASKNRRPRKGPRGSDTGTQRVSHGLIPARPKKRGTNKNVSKKTKKGGLRT